MVLFLQSFLSVMLRCIGLLNQVTVNNGVLTAGFFTICIGFVLFRILVRNFVK